MSTRVLTAHIPEELASKIDEIASRIDRSKGWIVKQALNDWVSLDEERHQLTLEALNDVDSGNVVSHDAIKLWAAGLDEHKARN